MWYLVQKREKLHKCTIDFMEEIERFGARQGCRKHAPHLIVENKQKVFDFRNVDVGKPTLMAIKVLNRSSKMVMASGVDNVVTSTEQETGEVSHWRFQDRRISVYPRNFTLEESQSKLLYVCFHPEQEYSTFETPLVLNIAGADYTITTLRMRAVTKRIERPLELKEESKEDRSENGTSDSECEDTIDEDFELLNKALGTAATSHLRGFGETAKRRLSLTFQNHNSFVKKEQPEELRKLGDNETLTRSTLMDHLMESVGWYLREEGEEDDVTLFFHKASGVFLEMPTNREIRNSVAAVDEVEITFNDSSRDYYWEIWHHNQLLERGLLIGQSLMRKQALAN